MATTTATRKAAPTPNALQALLKAVEAQSKEGQKDRGPMDYEVEHVGRKIILPNEPSPLGLLEGAEILQQMHEEQEQEILIHEKIAGAHFVDGLVAFTDAMEEVFGWTRAVPTPTMFGPKPPMMIDVPISISEHRRVLTGRFEMPNIKGFVQVGMDEDDGVTVFAIQGKTIRKFQPLFEALAEKTREYVRTRSIFRNKAFELLFTPEGKISDTAPRFIDLSGAEQPIFSHETEAALQANIFTPIERSAECRAMGIPLKRGILLEGPYGTGKTLVSRKAGQKAVENGWTQITIRQAKNLASALEFARKFQPAVVFVEDIDREMSGEDRTVAIDNILNTLDGVDSKSAEVMVVFTSNHAENINRAMLRPGRLDAVISIQNPDADAAKRLAQVYGGKLLDSSADYQIAADAMAGHSPAVIREIVERAKLYALGVHKAGDQFFLTPESLVDSATTMNRQLGLLDVKTPVAPDAGAVFIEAIVSATTAAVLSKMKEPQADLPETRKDLKKIKAAMGIS